MLNILKSIQYITILLKSHGVAYPNEHAARMTNPDQYTSFSRENNKAGVDVVLGWKDGKSEVQAYRFDPKKFTPEEARQWLKDHNFKPLSFEPATHDKTERPK